MKKHIIIEDLVIDYGESLAVDKVNIEIEQGELVTLLGPSGCGKSTTLNALAGLITPTSGKLIFGDKDVTRTSPKDRDIGLVFQSYALYPHMSVYDNIAFSLRSSESYKKKILEFNKDIDYKIKEVKWNALGNDAKEFKNHLKNIENYRQLLNEKLKKLLEVNDIAQTKKKIAKDLIPTAKTKMNGKIKARSEKMLIRLDEIDNNLKELKDDFILQNKKLTNASDKVDARMSYQEKVKEINSNKNEELKAYNEKINEYKAKFKKILPDLKKEKAEIISEASKFRGEEFKMIMGEYNPKIQEARLHFNKSLSIINRLTNTYKPGDDKADSQISKLSNSKKDLVIEIDNAVKEVADKVGITANLHKKVTQLSGGQQQRVAISRTLVKNPSILLLDEPLSNLDAKMRISTREWIRNLQQELGITTVFVTHDQEEAMSISDKIVCMSVGNVQQIAKPMDMYHQPANKFVAGFLGMPMMNFFTDDKVATELAKATRQKIEDVTFGCRPEHIKLVDELKKPTDSLIKLDVKVELIESFGRETLITAKADKETIRFFAEESELKRGKKVQVAFRKNKVYAFSREDDERTLGRY